MEPKDSLEKNKHSFLRSKQQIAIEYLRRTGFLSPVMREIANHATKFFSLSILGYIITFIAGVVIARILSKEEFGQFALIGAYLGICGFFEGGGFSIALTQSVARGHHGLYRRSMLISFIGTIIGIALVGSIAWFTPLRDKIEGFTALYVAAAFWPFIIGLGKWAVFLDGKKKFATAKAWGVTKNVLSSIAVIVVVLLLGPSLIAIVICSYGVLLLWNLLCSYKVWRKEVENDSVEPGIMRYGFMTSLYRISFPIAGHIDKFIIVSCLGLKELAVYYIATRIWGEIRVFQRELTKLLIPYYANMSALNRGVRRKIWVSFLIYTLGITLFAFTILPPVINILFDGKYNESIFIAQILIISTPILMLDLLFRRFITSKKDISGFRNITIIPNIFRILLFAIFIPAFKINGAVFSIVLTHMVMLSVTMLTVKKFYKSQTP